MSFVWLGLSQKQHPPSPCVICQGLLGQQQPYSLQTQHYSCQCCSSTCRKNNSIVWKHFKQCISCTLHFCNILTINVNCLNCLAISHIVGKLSLKLLVDHKKQSAYMPKPMYSYKHVCFLLHTRRRASAHTRASAPARAGSPAHTGAQACASARVCACTHASMHAGTLACRHAHRLARTHADTRERGHAGTHSGAPVRTHARMHKARLFSSKLLLQSTFVTRFCIVCDRKSYTESTGCECNITILIATVGNCS